MKFTVEIKTWARVNEDLDMGESNLLNDLGNKCCLGFVCEQLGIPNIKLLEVSEPAYLFNLDHSNKTTEEQDKLLETLSSFVERNKTHFKNSSLTVKAISINDNKNITDENKINGLKSLFKEYNHEIEFV
jgi:hypothetical protein